MRHLWVGLTTTMFACVGARDTPSHSASPLVPVSVATSTPAATPPPSPSDREVTVAPQITSRGGRVLRIGEPRLQVVPGDFGRFEVRLAAKRAFAVDRTELKIWELEHGALIQRVELAPEYNPAIQFAVSADGAVVAAGDARRFAVRREPFTTDLFEFTRASPLRFTHDQAHLYAARGGLISVDLVRQAEIATSPPSPLKTIGSLDVATSENDDLVWWIREKGLLQWDLKANSIKVAPMRCPRRTGVRRNQHNHLWTTPRLSRR